jgi:hypothetical protein
MKATRPQRIVRALGWRQVNLLREMNRVARTNYKSGDAWKWFAGIRGIPLGVGIFLRTSVAIARLRRQRRC